jgi:hypothetical protein
MKKAWMPLTRTNVEHLAGRNACHLSMQVKRKVHNVALGYLTVKNTLKAFEHLVFLSFEP